MIFFSRVRNQITVYNSRFFDSNNRNLVISHNISNKTSNIPSNCRISSFYKIQASSIFRVLQILSQVGGSRLDNPKLSQVHPDFNPNPGDAGIILPQKPKQNPKQTPEQLIKKEIDKTRETLLAAEFGNGDRKIWCFVMKDKYQIIPGQSYGNLPATMHKQFSHARCDRYFCKPHPMSGKGKFTCEPL